MATLLSLPRETLDHIASFLPRRPRERGLDASLPLGTGFELALCCRDLVDVGLRAVYRSVEINTKSQWTGFRVAVFSRPSIANWVIALNIDWPWADLPRPGHPVLPQCKSLDASFRAEFPTGASIGFGLAFAAAVCPNVLAVRMKYPDADRDFEGEATAPSSLRELEVSLGAGLLDFGRRFGVCGSSLRSLCATLVHAIPVTNLLSLGPACPRLERLELGGFEGAFPLPMEEAKRIAGRTVFPSLKTLTISSLHNPSVFLNSSQLPSLRSLNVVQHEDVGDEDNLGPDLQCLGFEHHLSKVASALRRNVHALPSLAEINVVLNFQSEDFLDPIRELEDWARRRDITFSLVGLGD